MQQFTDKLIASFDRTSSWSDQRWLIHPLLQLLAAGQPASVDQLASETGRSTQQVADALSALPGVEFNNNGDAVGLGLTLNPTRHHLALDGTATQLYTWCALDTLIFPPLLGRTAKVSSPCRATNESVRMTVTPDGVVDVIPQTAVVSVVAPDDVSNLRASFCDSVHFFVSADAAADWLADHPRARVIPVPDAFDLARRLGTAQFEDPTCRARCSSCESAA